MEAADGVQIVQAGDPLLRYSNKFRSILGQILVSLLVLIAYLALGLRGLQGDELVLHRVIHDLEGDVWASDGLPKAIEVEQGIYPIVFEAHLDELCLDHTAASVGVGRLQNQGLSML